MKKNKKKLLIIVACIVGIFLICGNIDYHFRVKHNKPPIMSIYIGKNKDDEVKKWLGFGYMVTKCPESFNANDNKYKISILSSTVACVQSFDVYIEPNNYTIVDETKSCNTALEEIARDKRYIYYLDCIKSETIFLKYENGDKITLKKALSNKTVSIYELMDRGLEVYQKRIAG